MSGLPVEGQVLAGKYRVERVVGRGGMGVVVAAWHLELDQRVALKFLHPEFAEREEAAERFRREAQSAAKIKSEHVVRVLDVGVFDGQTPCIVMEYLDGQDLCTELHARGVLPIREAVDYVLQAIEAIAEAHALGIIHRDLKPENLFLARRADGSHSVKVLDFGISKVTLFGPSARRSLTEASTMMGSPLYMSPEQLRASRDVDARTDIWSLGVILYELIAGRPPYVADTIHQLCVMLLEGDVPSFHGLRAEVDAELERVVMGCLARDCSQRWASVAELAHALLPFASPASRVHVERAGRMLGLREGSAPNALQTPTSVAPVWVGRVARTETPHEVTGVSVNSMGQADTQAIVSRVPIAPSASGPQATQGPWGNTRDSHRAVRPPSRAGSVRPRWPVFALMGMVLLFVVGVFARFLWSRHAPPGRASAPLLSASGRPELVAPLRGSAEESGPGQDHVDVGLPASGHAVVEGSSAAERSIPFAVTRPKKTTLLPVPQPQPQESKPSSGGGLTDFGGRQ